ncbi:MAG: hypothetical protein ACSW8G_06060 [Bacillota bacterium]
MNRKKILALIMTAVLAIGMAVVITACGDEAQDAEQAVAGEESETPAEDAESVAENVDEIVALAGEYQDEVSQRATATVITNTESQNLNITVMWGSSAWETTMWTMTATKEGNKLVYSDCKRTEMIFSDDTDSEGTGNDEIGGGAEETVVYENGSGSFEVSTDGKLLWTGAADPECQECVFVQFVE